MNDRALRLIEQPWAGAVNRFAVQFDAGYDTWTTIETFMDDRTAKEFLALYAKGPRLIKLLPLKTSSKPSPKRSTSQAHRS